MDGKEGIGDPCKLLVGLHRVVAGLMLTPVVLLLKLGLVCAANVLPDPPRDPCNGSKETLLPVSIKEGLGFAPDAVLLPIGLFAIALALGL